MADDQTIRLARIDLAITAARAHRDCADDACHGMEADWHETEIDRLLDLRNRVQRKGLLTIAVKELP